MKLGTGVLAWGLFAGALGLAACEPPTDRATLRGTSALVGYMNDAAAEHRVPAELLAGVAWTETALTDHTARFEGEDHADGHVPPSSGVMGLPAEGAVRSVTRAARLLGVSESAVTHELATNVRGAAAILRAIADERFGPGQLGADGDREQWLRVVELYFDAGAVSADLALEVRRTIARGISITDDAGLQLEIPSYAELYAHLAPDFATSARGQSAGAEYPSAAWVPAHSSNYTNTSRTNADIDVVVIHTVQGSYAGAISWFQNSSSNVSAHYVIRRSDGAITQMVRHEDRAWHVGNYNSRSIGIEHEGWVSDPANYTPVMYERSAQLTRWLCDTLGIPRDRSHIIGHIEAPGATHTDPGPHWNWTHYMTLVNGGTPPPPPTMGTLKGVIYRGTDTASRIQGATVTISPGGRTFTSSDIGYFEASLAPGDYTIRAEAPGFDPASVMRSVVAGNEAWGSVGLVPASGPGVGTYRGVVYDASASDLSVRLPGATVRLSSGASVTSAADGAFSFEVAPGDYTATAELAGWQTAQTMRTVTAGGVAWGSIGLVRAGTGNQPPAVPELRSPKGGATVPSLRPRFAVGRLVDAEQDALTVTVEVYADEGLSQQISTVTVQAAAGIERVVFEYPANDLLRGASMWWTARASDAAGASPWAAPERFQTLDDGTPADAPGGAHTAEPLPGAPVNTAPTEAMLIRPTDGEVMTSLRPAMAARATDADGDALAFRFQIAKDELFETLVVDSHLVAEEWTPSEDVASGRYFARVAAADPYVVGAWSSAVAFTIEVLEAPHPETPIEEGGCRSTAGGSSGLGVLLSLLALTWLRRRR